MTNSLVIPANGALDLLALGAVVTRLDPGVIPFRKAKSYAVHVSGGEFNVAASLSDAFGLRTGIATAMVDYPIGQLVAEGVRSMGVTGFYRQFDHDGVTGPNIATVFSDRGLGMRAPVVFYNRANEAAARLAPGDFDWAAIFGAGVRWFHSGGIFAALSATTPELIVEAMRAARAAGAVVSFDVNYRAKLWRALGGGESAHDVLRQIVEHVDVLVGNEEDLQVGLGIPGPEVRSPAGLDPASFVSMIDRVTDRFPRIRIVASDVAPLGYLSLVWSFLAGSIVFGEALQARALAGALAIAAGGVVTLRSSGQDEAVPPPSVDYGGPLDREDLASIRA